MQNALNTIELLQKERDTLKAENSNWRDTRLEKLCSFGWPLGNEFGRDTGADQETNEKN